MLENVHILYADDDPKMLESLAYMTRKKGWVGDQATSATEVVRKVNEHCCEGTECYDAIITAISFFSGTKHAITGVTAAKLIRKVHADIPIIFLSTHANTILREEIRRVDAELVSKPIDDMEALFQKVERLIKWHRTSKERSSYTGKERRVLSINTSTNFRRASDLELTVPPRLKQILNEVNKNER